MKVWPSLVMKVRPPFVGLKAQSGSDGYSDGALSWILAGALPSIGGAQVRITGAFNLEYSATSVTEVRLQKFIAFDVSGCKH